MRPNWFVALPLPGEGWLDDYLRDAPRAVRRFAATDLHITVAFLGGVDEEAARAAWAHAWAPDQPSFPVTLTELVPMGNPRRPSALSLLLDEGREEATDLIAALRSPLLTAAEARPGDRPPKPHVTVARPRRRATDDERRAALGWAREKGRPDIALTASDLALYTWSEHRVTGGPPPTPSSQFRVVERRPLGAP